MTSVSQSVPWVEKYRPSEFSNIVLDPTNRTIFKNIINKDYFPNLLFYGPPGTGKTTTIINLINEHQRKHSKINKENVIHLNASDERGIDIIRNQIQQFVKSNSFFEVGIKFVILDEADYMTKNAQQALKYLMQSSKCNVRFCLICNYISKLVTSLQSEFICVRFDQLPEIEIYKFIKNVSNQEKLQLSDIDIQTIQKTYRSDIRSMINFIQLNQNLSEWSGSIITNDSWEKIYELHRVEKTTELKELIQYISIKYNIDKKGIIIKYFNYMIRNKIHATTPLFLDNVEVITHSDNADLNSIIDYFCVNFIGSYI
jgi:DNA polymerase III delta prime subunit